MHTPFIQINIPQPPPPQFDHPEAPKYEKVSIAVDMETKDIRELERQLKQIKEQIHCVVLTSMTSVFSPGWNL